MQERQKQGMNFRCVDAVVVFCPGRCLRQQMRRPEHFARPVLIQHG